MTTPLVQPITDDLIEALEAIEHDASFVTREPDNQEYLGMLARRVLDRLRSAEQDARRYRWLRRFSYGKFRYGELELMFSQDDDVIDQMVDVAMDAHYRGTPTAPE